MNWRCTPSPLPLFSRSPTSCPGGPDIRLPAASDAGVGLRLSEHLHGDGMEIFEHACKLGCEGIVSKRLGSRYVSGRTSHWVKVKNPAAPAVKREAEEDWGKKRWRR